MNTVNKLGVLLNIIIYIYIYIYVYLEIAMSSLGGGLSMNFSGPKKKKKRSLAPPMPTAGIFWVWGGVWSHLLLLLLFFVKRRDSPSPCVPFRSKLYIYLALHICYLLVVILHAVTNLAFENHNCMQMQICKLHFCGCNSHFFFVVPFPWCIFNYYCYFHVKITLFLNFIFALCNFHIDIDYEKI